MRQPSLPGLDPVRWDTPDDRLISRLRAINTHPRHLPRIEPGYWLLRGSNGRPARFGCIRWVHTILEPYGEDTFMGEPAAIAWPPNVMDRGPFLAAFIDGYPVPLADVWDRRGGPISRELYFEMASFARDWARPGRKTYARNVPIANPHRRTDWLTCELPRTYA